MKNDKKKTEYSLQYCEFHDRKRMDYAYLYMGDCFSSLSRFLRYTLTAHRDGDFPFYGGSHLNNIDNKFKGI